MMWSMSVLELRWAAGLRSRRRADTRYPFIIKRLSMIHYTGNSYVLAVRSFEPTLSFFTQVMELEQCPAPKGWVIVRSPKFVIWMGECPDDMLASETGCHSFFAYFVVEKVRELYEKASGYNGIQCSALRQADDTGMLEFSIRLPEGHGIMIGEDVKIV